MQKKFNDFIRVTKILNKWGITPVLYGSLGLYQIIEPLNPVDDIDYLIPETYLKDRWLDFKGYLESMGFRMDDEHEHEFSHKEIEGWIAFGSLEESKQHSGLTIEKLTPVDKQGARFYVLDASQYLRAYEASLKDNYRKERKGDADNQKIAALKKYLSKVN